MSGVEERELDRVLARVADPVMPAGLVERILATVPHLPQEGAVPEVASATAGPHPRWQIRPAALGMIAAGFAALVVFALPAGRPAFRPVPGPVPAAAPQVAAASTDVVPPPLARAPAAAPMPVRKSPAPRAVQGSAALHPDQPAATPAELAVPAAAAQEPALAAAESVPRGPKLGPPVPDDLRQDDGYGPRANPLAPASQTGFGFRAGPGD